VKRAEFVWGETALRASHERAPITRQRWQAYPGLHRFDLIGFKKIETVGTTTEFFKDIWLEGSQSPLYKVVLRSDYLWKILGIVGIRMGYQSGTPSAVTDRSSAG